MYEASLLVHPELNSNDTWAFIIQYGVNNFLPSCLWNTCPADITAVSLDLPVDEVGVR